MGRIGLPEVILILAVFILFFGARRLPEAGAAIGKAVRAFKKGLNEDVSDEETKKAVEEKKA